MARSMRQRSIFAVAGLWVFIVAASIGVIAQAQGASQGAGIKADKAVTPPPGYVIGVDDSLAIRFWGDEKMSAEVTVRPDGKVSVPLLNDVQAAGLTPEELGATLHKAALKFVEDPNVTVIVREIRSRRVFVIGQVGKTGPVQLNADMNVLQLLSAAGGLLEYADKENIIILRTENGREKRLKFNFSDVVKGKNVAQNILLQPGDTIIVN
jgi:polysaccharide export outer membrane protein